MPCPSALVETYAFRHPELAEGAFPSVSFRACRGNVPLLSTRACRGSVPLRVISSGAAAKRRRSREIFGNYPARVLYSLFCNTICIRPSRGGVKTRSKACVVLPCLQGVKRARRNRRRMGACPWQLVAESAGFSAADYSPPFLLGGSFFGSQGLSPCNAYALRRAFALVRLKRNAWLCPCKQAKPSRPFRVT